MNNSLCRVVFKGEIFPGYDRIPVMQNVRTLCGYDDAALTKLFSGKACILKDRVDRQQAQKYKSALEMTGIVCHIQEIQVNQATS